DPPDHDDQRVLGQQAGRAAPGPRGGQREIPRVGEPGPARQRRRQAALAQDARRPGYPLGRATGIGGHADQHHLAGDDPGEATGPAGGGLAVVDPPTTRVRLALAEAPRARDTIAVSALRSALGAIGNAEAVEPGRTTPAGSAGPHVAGAVPGLGAA